MPQTRSKGTPPQPPIISKYPLRKFTKDSNKEKSAGEKRISKKPPKTKKIKKLPKTVSPRSRSKTNEGSRSKSQKKTQKTDSSTEKQKKMTFKRDKEICLRASSRIKEIREKLEKQARKVNLRKQIQQITKKKKKQRQKSASKKSKASIKHLSGTKQTSLFKSHPKKTSNLQGSKPKLSRLQRKSSVPRILILPPPPKPRGKRRSMSPEIRNEESKQNFRKYIVPRSRQKRGRTSSLRPIIKANRHRVVREIFPISSDPIVKEENVISNIVVTEQRQEQSVSQDSPPRFKTLAELERIKRGREQRIFLLEAKREENEEWIFRVFGTQGQIYTTRIHKVVRCSCFDFRTTKRPCKHIYFIFLQIAQNSKLLEALVQTELSQEGLLELDDCLKTRLKSRLEKNHDVGDEVKQIDLKDETDCVICFTEMKKDEEVLTDCSVCKKYFHAECLKNWRRLNNTCPLCRSQFKLVKQEESDPLSKLQALYI